MVILCEFASKDGRVLLYSTYPVCPIFIPITRDHFMKISEKNWLWKKLIIAKYSFGSMMHL